MLDHTGELIRRLRRDLGLTQEDFAHELGITVGTVNRWENGRFRPSRLARATLVEFAERRGHPTPVFASGPLNQNRRRP
jgi:putative transcriptional regulator